MAGTLWRFTVSPDTINEVTITNGTKTVTLQKSGSFFSTDSFVETNPVTISAKGYISVTNVEVGTSSISMTASSSEQSLSILVDSSGKALLYNNQAIYIGGSTPMPSTEKITYEMEVPESVDITCFDVISGSAIISDFIDITDVCIAIGTSKVAFPYFKFTDTNDNIEYVVPVVLENIDHAHDSGTISLCGAFLYMGSPHCIQATLTLAFLESIEESDIVDYPVLLEEEYKLKGI